MPDPLLPTEEETSPVPFPDEEENDSAPTPVLPETAPEFPTFKRAVALLRAKSRNKRELEEIDAELKRLQPLVSSYFAQHTLPRLTIDGMTLYIRRDLWARPKSKGQTPEVCRVMRATGYEHFVHDTFNVNSLSAHIRDLERQNLDRIDSGEIADVTALLPPALAAVLNVGSTYTLLGAASTRSAA
jgi:hypothetical protein